jgi:hypothetical protein
MRLRVLLAVLGGLMVAFGGSAYAQTAEPAPPTYDVTPQNVPTPINSFSDAAGRWTGEVAISSSVTMTIGKDGMVSFRGPSSVTQQAQLRNERLILSSRRTDLDCGIMNTKLTCHVRMGDMYAELNLTKQQ